MLSRCHIGVFDAWPWPCWLHLDCAYPRHTLIRHLIPLRLLFSHLAVRSLLDAYIQSVERVSAQCMTFCMLLSLTLLVWSSGLCKSSPKWPSASPTFGFHAPAMNAQSKNFLKIILAGGIVPRKLERGDADANWSLAQILSYTGTAENTIKWRNRMLFWDGAIGLYRILAASPPAKPFGIRLFVPPEIQADLHHYAGYEFSSNAAAIAAKWEATHNSYEYNFYSCLSAFRHPLSLCRPCICKLHDRSVSEQHEFKVLFSPIWLPRQKYSLATLGTWFGFLHLKFEPLRFQNLKLKSVGFSAFWEVAVILRAAAPNISLCS